MSLTAEEPDIVSITPYVYVSGTGGNVKGGIKNAPKIQICTACLVLAVGGTSSSLSKEARHLFAAFRSSLTHRYSEMVGGVKQ
jgi:hypothetical protein